MNDLWHMFFSQASHSVMIKLVVIDHITALMHDGKLQRIVNCISQLNI